MRSLVVTFVALGTACAGGGRSSRPPGTEQALARLGRLAAAMQADDAWRALEVGDPRDGIVFWGTPGAYPRPLFRVPAGSNGLLSQFAERASADGYYTEPSGYWREAGAVLERALAVAQIDAGPYQVPPEDELKRAPPWGSLDTHRVTLTAKEYPALDEESEASELAKRQVQRYRFRAEVGGSSVTVYMTERGITHVILTWHYDA